MNMSLKTHPAFGYVALVVVMFSAFVLAANPFYDNAMQEITEILTSVADRSEATFDGNRTWYCQKYQSQFYDQENAWPAVVAECLDPLVFHPQSRVGYPEVKDKVNMQLIKFYVACAKSVKNPCIDSDWLEMNEVWIWVHFGNLSQLSKQCEGGA